MMNLHHAAADGMAAVRLLRAVAAAYAGRSDPMALESAATLTVPSPRGWRALRIALSELSTAARRHAHVVGEGGSDEAGYGFCQVALSRSETEAIKRVARGGVTVNDLLIAALHSSIDRWNREHGRPAGRIGVLMPVNLRPRAVWDDVIGNFTFMLPVTTTRRQRTTPEATVETVRARTRAIKESRRAAAVASLLPHVQRLPLRARQGVAHLASREAIMPSAMLSNLGRLPHVDFGPGAGEPVEAWFSPPAEMPLGLAVGAVTTGRRLHLAFRYRHPLFGPGAAQAFADVFRSTLDTFAPAPSDAASAKRAARAA
jgi:NRPS condensation-like uncharacterized protein